MKTNGECEDGCVSDCSGNPFAQRSKQKIETKSAAKGNAQNKKSQTNLPGFTIYNLIGV